MKSLFFLVEARVLSLIIFVSKKRYRCADIGENRSVPAGLKSLLSLTVDSYYSRALISQEFVPVGTVEDYIQCMKPMVISLVTL